MFKRLGLPILLALLFVGVGGWLVSQPFWQSLQRIAVAMRVINAEYVDAEAVDYEALAAAAIRGMADALDDHSGYLDASDYSHFSEITRQEYIGVGIEIEQLQGRVTVIDVFAGGPAAEAGIRPGHRFVSIDEVDVSEADVAKVSSLLRGAADTPVRLQLESDTHGPRLYQVKRGPVHLDTVFTEPVSEDGLGYVLISQFGDSTAREFSKARMQLEEEGMRALILDLRNNPGGLLTASRDVAAEFFNKDALIVYTEGRDQDVRREYVSLNDRRAGDYPVVVLINENSASGAEIVAGALQDAGHAQIVGERSRGKGSVQSIYGFRAGDGLRQTTALYYLPSGRSIHKSGIVPDLEIEVSAEEETQRLLQERHRKFLRPEEFEAIFEFEPEVPDRQRIAATELLQEILRTQKRRV